jgi:membrane-bound lytic murein transglycosylase B
VILLAAVATLVVPSLGRTASAAGPPTSAPAPAKVASAGGPPLVNDPRLSPALRAVPVSSPDYDAAQADYATDWTSLGDAHTRERVASAELAVLARTEARLDADLAMATRRHDKSSRRIQQLRRSLATLAVAVYENGSASGAGPSSLVASQTSPAQLTHVYVGAIGADRVTDLHVNEAIVRQTGAVVRSDTESLADVQRRQLAELAALAAARRDDATLTARVTDDRHRVADTRMTADVTGLDLTLVVLDAYWRASVTARVDDPACKLGWSALAGIGHVESVNGTFGGDSVDATGEEAFPIIGIALDGTNGTARVGDTDGGALDHDPRFDRAVGPMQLLPSAWRTYGRDGNHDGRDDPQNMYDAAQAAAVMLCRYGPLDSDAGLRTTFFHYNPSAAYVDEVLGYTHDYATFAIPRVT